MPSWNATAPRAFWPDILKQPHARTLMFLPVAHALGRAVQISCLHAGAMLGHATSAAALPDAQVTFKPTVLLAPPHNLDTIRAGAAHKAAVAGKTRIFAAAAAAVRYSTEQDSAARGRGNGPGAMLRLQHALFDRLVFAGIRQLLGGRVGHMLCGTGPPARTRVGSVGVPLPGTTVRVAEDGEVLVKGIGVFRGCHANDAATAEAFVGGFFRTGDFGELDPEGYLTITGRTKDLPGPAGG